MAGEHTCERYTCRHPYQDHYGETCVRCSCRGLVETLAGHTCDSGGSGGFSRAGCTDTCQVLHSFCTLCGVKQDPCGTLDQTDRIPCREEVDLARQALDGFAALRDPLVEHGPDSVRESFAYMEQVVAAADQIAATQPEALAAYAEDLYAIAEEQWQEYKRRGGFDAGRRIVDAILGSVTLAQMLADQR